MSAEHRLERSKVGDAEISREAFAALSQLLDLMRGRAHDVARRAGLPLPAAIALTRLDEPVAMNRLGHELGCDPSFVTSLADTLEQRGLIVRQPDPTDRRVRKLELTAEGRTMKTTLETGFAESLPGIGALAPAERHAFVDLLRKMVAAERSDTTNGEKA
jgi:DNA-binding MarR family transcriptional regulator